jgi:hypothetical protein
MSAFPEPFQQAFQELFGFGRELVRFSAHCSSRLISVFSFCSFGNVAPSFGIGPFLPQFCACSKFSRVEQKSTTMIVVKVEPVSGGQIPFLVLP